MRFISGDILSGVIEIGVRRLIDDLRGVLNRGVVIQRWTWGGRADGRYDLGELRSGLSNGVRGSQDTQA